MQFRDFFDTSPSEFESTLDLFNSPNCSERNFTFDVTSAKIRLHNSIKRGGPPAAAYFPCSFKTLREPYHDTSNDINIFHNYLHADEGEVFSKLKSRLFKFVK